MIHPAPSFRPHELALPQHARLMWRYVGTWMVAALVLTMLISAAAAPRRAGSESQGSMAFAEPTHLHHELSDGDPPREPKHQESPAKKPRLKALLVQTTPATDPTQPLSFHMRPDDAALVSHLAPLRAAPELRSRREDPALRLHPGQAPPRHVA